MKEAVSPSLRLSVCPRFRRHEFKEESSTSIGITDQYLRLTEIHILCSPKGKLHNKRTICFREPVSINFLNFWLESTAWGENFVDVLGGE